MIFNPEILAMIEQQILYSASPGFSFGRSGTVTRGSFLLCETVPSNVVGRRVYISNAAIRSVFVGNQLTTSIKYDVLYHYGSLSGVAVLGNITVPGGSNGGEFLINWSVPTGSYIAMRVASDSPNNPKEVVAGLIVWGVYG